MEGLLDEEPLKSVKGFLQVYLKDPASLLLLYFLKMRNDLLDNYGIIRGPPVRNKAALSLANDLV